MKLLEIFDETPKTKKVIMEASLPAFQPGIQQIGSNQWGLFLDDGRSFYTFANQADATQALDDLTNPNMSENDFRRRYGRPTANRWSRASVSMSMNEFEAAGRRSPNGIVAKVLRSSAWRGFFRTAGLVGMGVGAILGSIAAIDEVMSDPNMSQDEKEQERNILVGILGIEIVLILAAIFRTASLIRTALRGIKAIVRGIQIGAAVTGVGTIPAIASMIVSEAGFFALTYAMSSPTVQRLLASWIKDTLIGELVGGFGVAIGTTVSMLDQATDSAFGTGAIRRALGFEEGQASEAVDGEVYASSEWAKLVFHHLIFPSDEKIMVPYIDPDRREQVLFEKLNITSSLNPEGEQPTTNTEPQTGGTGATAPGDQGDGTRGNPQTPPQGANTGGPGFRPGQ